MDFGLSMTNLTEYLRFGRRIVVEVLKNDKYAKIAIPSPEKVDEYKQAISAKYPILNDVWATMDGLKTPIQQAGSTKKQSYFYNGWKHGHFITSIIVIHHIALKVFVSVVMLKLLIPDDPVDLSLFSMIMLRICLATRTSSGILGEPVGSLVRYKLWNLDVIAVTE